MNFFEELKLRGLVQDYSDEEGIKKLKADDCFYVGFDPTAPALQIGNLVPIIVSLHLARAGLKPIYLFGGATGAIGDPSGKSIERQLLSREQIDSNIKNHQKIVRNILGRAASQMEATFVNNFDWTHNISILDFLRDTGKHFTVNYMISKEVVKTRLNGEGISYTEFSYMLLQALDFHHLNGKYNCKLQVGGSDQWGNITAGLELIRRKGGGDAYAFSIPLVTDSQGKKFGKTAGGAVWLDAEHTSPYKFHQFWLNTPDTEAIKYLKIFSFLDNNQINEIENSFKSAPEKREAQNKLADEICNLVHGEEATRDARRCAEVLFGGSTSELSKEQLSDIFSDSPSSTLEKSKLSETGFIDLMLMSGLVKSKGDARRLIESGGAYINNNRISDINLKLDTSHLGKSGMIVLRSGKKNYHLVKVE